MTSQRNWSAWMTTMFGRRAFPSGELVPELFSAAPAETAGQAAAAADPTRNSRLVRGDFEVWGERDSFMVSDSFHSGHSAVSAGCPNPSSEGGIQGLHCTRCKGGESICLRVGRVKASRRRAFFEDRFQFFERLGLWDYLKRFRNFSSRPKMPFWSRNPRIDMRGLMVQLNSNTRYWELAVVVW